MACYLANPEVLMSALEASIRRLTQPVNGQFPRPWMTNMARPENARIFVVGYNQATGFPAALIGSHDDYIDALFNRNDGSCRNLYEQLRDDDGTSPTRRNIDKLRVNLAVSVTVLELFGVGGVFGAGSAGCKKHQNESR